MKSVPLQKGFYVNPRNIEVNEVYGNKNVMAVWLYLKGQAGYALGHWRDHEKIIVLKEGDLVLSQRSASRKCGMAQETFKKALKALEKKGLVAFRSIKTGTLVSLAKRVIDAVIQSRALNRDHKERKDITRSISTTGSYKDPKSGGGSFRWVMDAEQTQEYLGNLEREKPATSIPKVAMDFLRSL